MSFFIFNKYKLLFNIIKILIKYIEFKNIKKSYIMKLTLKCFIFNHL